MSHPTTQPHTVDAISIPRPHVPYGPKDLTVDLADITYLRRAARDLEKHYKPFGSNLRATIVKLVHDAADAIESGDTTVAIENRGTAIALVHRIAVDESDPRDSVIVTEPGGRSYNIHREDADPEHRELVYRLAAGWFGNLPAAAAPTSTNRV